MSQREDYEKDLRRRQEDHIAEITRRNDLNWRPCLHDSCPECIGTGLRRIGGSCIHMISCPCPKCTPTCSWTAVSFGTRTAYQVPT